MVAKSFLNKSFNSGFLFLWLIGVFIFLSSKGYSQQIDSQEYTGSDVFGTQLTVDISDSPTLDYKVEESKFYIKIGIGELYKLGENIDFDLSLKLRVLEDIGQGLFETAVIDLDGNDLNNLNNSNPEIIYAYNYAGAPDELDIVGIFIDNIVDWNDVSLNPIVQNYIENNITVELRSEIDYRIDVRKEEMPVAPILNPFSDIELTNRYQVFSWEDNTPDNFPNYQFELLRLYNSDNLLANKTKEIATTIDWSKALRIETQSRDKQIALTIAEGTGFYVWRVRPIGTFYEGGIADDRNWGEWSVAPAQGEKILNLSLANIADPYYFYFEDPDDEKNWIYSRTFSENNKVSEQISYANGLQQLRQSQTYLNSKDTSLITQTILDFSGRPSLTTIPVPVEGRLQPYQTRLVTTNDDLYTAENFDNNDLILTKVDSGGVYSYYSDNNLNQTIPSSQGYPFTRVVYANDPTGRVIEQGGAGKRHAIGNQSDGMGRTTRTIYGNPSDEELIRIFGDEAPRADAVLKTTTIDPNNQASVTYTSKEGNVIATCLVVNENVNMDEIDGGVPAVNNLKSGTSQNVFTGEQFVSSRKIVLSKQTEVQIQYNIDCKVLDLGCEIAEGNCEYQVEFQIINLETNEVFKSNLFDICGLNGKKIIDESSIWEWDQLIGDEFVPVSGGFDNNIATLPVGKYMIKKIVSVGATEETFTVEQAFRDSKLMIRPLVDVIYNWLNSVRCEEDMENFYKVVQDFGNIINTPSLNDPPLTNAEALEEAKSVYDEKLGGVTIVDEFELNDNHSIIFYPEYIPATITTEAQLPRVLTLTGGCCGDIKIPVTYLPTITCYTVKEMREHTEYRPDFWNYINVALYDEYLTELNDLGYYLDNGTAIPEGGKNLLPGYDEATLNTMIYYMLTDEYKISNDPEETENVQYTCTEVWDAWQAVINSTLDILNSLPSSTPSLEEGAKKEDDENKENPEDDDPNSKDEHMNDDDNSDIQGGFIMRWILKRALSDRVDDFENVDSEGKGDPIELEFDIMGQFFQQLGYKFAAIVETDEDVLSGDFRVVNEDFNKDLLGVNNIAYNDIDVCTIDGCLENMPYIKNPVYAFKYFQYDGDDTKGRPRFFQVEIQHCYNSEDAFYTSDEVPNGIDNGGTLCDYYCGIDNYHDSWNHKKRYRFYRDIVNYKLPDVTDIEYLAEGESFDNALRVKAYDYFDLLKTCDICNDAEKIAAIRRKVEQTFIDNCYTIGGCPTDLNVVLQEDIDNIVAEIRQNCEDNCNDIFADINVDPPVDDPYPDYPEEVTTACWTLNEDALSFTKQINSLRFTILPDAKWNRYLNLKNWAVAFALDDTHSLCECKDDFSGNLLSSNWNVLDNDVWENTDVYPYYSALNIDTRSNAGEYLSVWTEDIKGDFNVSVKVAKHESQNGSSLGIIAAENMNDLGGTADILLTVTKGETVDKIEIKIDGVAQSLDGASKMDVDFTANPNGEYWIGLEKKTSDGLFYAYYKLNEEDAWGEVNSAGITGPLAVDYHIGLYAKELKIIDPDTSEELEGKAIFDDFNCGTLYPNQLENDEWIGGTNDPESDYYYPDVSE